MLQLLFFFFIFLIFLIFLFIVLPYHYDFNFNYSQGLNLNCSLSVLFFKINLDISNFKNQFYLQIFNYKKKLSIKNYSSEIKDHSKLVLYKLKTDKLILKLIDKEIIKHFFKFFKNIITEIKPNYFKLNILFSFSDPYYNGLVLAFYSAFKQFSKKSNLKIKINWQKVTFNADGKISGQIIPIKVLFIFLNFIFSLKTFKIFWRIYKSNNKSN